jgi:hypothetical protein
VLCPTMVGCVCLCASAVGHLEASMRIRDFN